MQTQLGAESGFHAKLGPLGSALQAQLRAQCWGAAQLQVLMLKIGGFKSESEGLVCKIENSLTVLRLHAILRWVLRQVCFNAPIQLIIRTADGVMDGHA